MAQTGRGRIANKLSAPRLAIRSKDGIIISDGSAPPLRKRQALLHRRFVTVLPAPSKPDEQRLANCPGIFGRAIKVRGALAGFCLTFLIDQPNPGRRRAAFALRSNKISPRCRAPKQWINLQLIHEVPGGYWLLLPHRATGFGVALCDRRTGCSSVATGVRAARTMRIGPSCISHRSQESRFHHRGLCGGRARA